MKIKIEVIIKGSLENVWTFYTDPAYVAYWNFASDDWWVPNLDIDFKESGRFKIRMEAKDKSFGFDFSGQYQHIVYLKSISYLLDDNRNVEIFFEQSGDHVKVRQEFDPDSDVDEDLQQAGWQLILNRFKEYCESDIKSFNYRFYLPCRKEKVWEFLTRLDLYKQWAFVFAEGAYFLGDWSENSEMEFLDASGYGTRAKVQKNVAFNEIRMKHIGLIDKETPDRQFTKESRMWIDLIEGYYLQDKEAGTDFTLYIEGHEALIPVILDAWKKASEILHLLLIKEN